MKSQGIFSSIKGLFQNKTTAAASTTLVVLIVATLATYLHVAYWQSVNKTYLDDTSQQGVLSQQIEKQALEAASCSDPSFPRLLASLDRFESLLNEMKNGNTAKGLPRVPASVVPTLHATENAWLHLREKVDTILDQQDAILSVEKFIGDVSTLAPELQRKSDEVVDILVNNQASRNLQRTASRQSMLAQRMENNVSKALSGGGVSAAAIDQFGRDANEFGRVVIALLEGDKGLGIAAVKNQAAIKKLDEIVVLYSTINDRAQQVIQTTLNVLPALDAAADLTAVSDTLNESTAKLSAVYGTTPGLLGVGGITLGPWAILALGIAALAALVLLGIRMLVDVRNQEAASESINQRNQEAILRLLDEMGDLASGDLTVQTTVTDDITGAIADSTNYTIEALRVLVTTINETSRKVAESAQETQQTAEYLTDKSGQQAMQITSATESFEQMAEAMNAMTDQAQESADVAEQSVALATRGSETVRSTIESMNDTREQIQETAKRIKRLGESSQQIGEIVELIDDISDQTNILALNAAMQAAMAGEAGRGFAVVADEVQRLAERSSNATKQIEALVKAIQADTNEAVASMEQSTAGVVRGAQLAEAAGDALYEINNVSSHISGITQQIVGLAQLQRSESGAITNTMQSIQAITTETTDGTTSTARSVGDLAALAEDLQQSVAGFKLPA